MDVTSEMQSITPSVLSRFNSDATSTASSFQTRNKINNEINPCSKEINNLIKERFQKRSDALPANKNLKDLCENEVHQKVMHEMFQHEVDITEALTMHEELKNIQGLNEESALFKDETKNNTRELKVANEI